MEEIFRVESKHTGNGWYNPGHHSTVSNWYEEAYDIWAEHSSNESQTRHPNPFDDGIEAFSVDHFFGFLSMKDLEGWFYEETLEAIESSVLKDYFEIVRYEVDAADVLHGEHQVAFLRHLASNRTVVTR
jgi:hypothetical protein